MSYQIHAKNAFNFDAKTLQTFNLACMTVYLVDHRLDINSGESMTFCEFLENNEDTFTPYKAVEIAHDLMRHDFAKIDADMESSLHLYLTGVCSNEGETWDSDSVEYIAI